MKSLRDIADESPMKGPGNFSTSDDALGLSWQCPWCSRSPRKPKYIESCDEEDDHQIKKEDGEINLYLLMKSGLSSVQ